MIFVGVQIFRKIFSEKKHPEGLKTFGFIWDMFRDRTGSPDNMHKALLWLQVGWFINVAVPLSVSECVLYVYIIPDRVPALIYNPVPLIREFDY